MKPISNGFAAAAARVDIEAVIDAIGIAKMRFFVRSPSTQINVDIIKYYFPNQSVLTPLPDDLSGKLWDWGKGGDPFIDVSSSVDAARSSYLSPAIHLNYYLDWLLFDQECEQGSHPKLDNPNRPSDVSRRGHFEVFAHSVLIAIKSALDRLVSIIGHYISGVSPRMTWGRIKDGKTKGFMSLVSGGRQNDALLEFLHQEYLSWISDVVAPRDEIIHYADLQTSWNFIGWTEDQKPRLSVSHRIDRDGAPPSIDLQALQHYVTSFYSLADHTLLTLATRLPLAVQKASPILKDNLGHAIMKAFGVPPSKRVGELQEAIARAVKAGELQSGLPPQTYVEFLRRDPERFGLTDL